MEVCKIAFKAEPPKDLKFMRKGKSGGWRKEIDDELAARINAWSKKQTQGTDCNLWNVQNL